MRLQAALRWGLVALWLAGTGFAGESEWVEIRSPHFSVVTDAGERRGREVAIRFEQMRAAFGTLMSKAKVNLPVPLQIIAFRNSKEFRQFTPLWKGKPMQVTGLFQNGEDRCFIMLDMSVENPWAVVFHEYAHQLMTGNMSSDIDPWFEEGFAEYFSSIEVVAGEVHVGKVPEDEYLILRQMGMMKVSDLFRVRQNSSTYSESGDHRTVFYAESGMLVHYIYDNGLIPKLAVYFDSIKNKKVPIEDGIQQAFGMGPAQLDKALQNYASSGRFKYYPLKTAAIDGKTYTTAPLSASDAQAVMADVHLHTADYRDRASSEFETVLKLDPNNTTALRGLGYSYLVKQDFARAGEYFGKALERNPDDPNVLYYCALLAGRQGRSDRERLDRTQQQLEKLIELQPERADAYSLLALNYMMQGNHVLALGQMLKAVELNPGNDGYRLNLAGIYLANRGFDVATKLYESLKDSQNPELASRAAQALGHIEENKVAATTMPAPSKETTLRRMEDSGGQPGAPASAPAPPENVTAAKFLKGKLMAVDCSAPPGAVLTILAGTKKWTMHTANSARMIVIGADQLSCAWANQKVAVNYQETGDGQGDLISLEIQ